MVASKVKIEDKDLGLKAILKQMNMLDGVAVDVGLYGSGNNPVDNLAERGAIQEFGTHDGRIPSRPFKRQTFSKFKKEAMKKIEHGFGAILGRKVKAKRMLKDLGEWYVGREKYIITVGSFLALSPLTIIKKHSTKPLIDEGDMRRAVKAKVRKVKIR